MSSDRKPNRVKSDGDNGRIQVFDRKKTLKPPILLPSKNSKSHKALIDYLKKESKAFNQIAQIPKFTSLSQRLVTQDFCLNTAPFTQSKPVSPKSRLEGRFSARLLQQAKQMHQKEDYLLDLKEAQEEANKKDRELEVKLLDAAQELQKCTIDPVRRQRIKSCSIDPLKLQMMKRFLANGINKEYVSFVQQKFEVCRSELNTKLIQQTVKDGASKYPNDDVQKEFERRIEKLKNLREYYLCTCSAPSLVDLFSRITPNGTLDWLGGDGKYKKTKLSDQIRDKYGISAQFGVFDIIEEIKDSDPANLVVPSSYLKNLGVIGRDSYSENQDSDRHSRGHRPSKSSSETSESQKLPSKLIKPNSKLQPQLNKSSQGRIGLSKPRSSKTVKFPGLADHKPSLKPIDYEEIPFDEGVFDPRYVDRMVKSQLDEIFTQMMGERYTKMKEGSPEQVESKLNKLHKNDQAFMGDTTMLVVENKIPQQGSQRDPDAEQFGSVDEQSDHPDPQNPEFVPPLFPIYSNKLSDDQGGQHLDKGRMQLLFQLNKSSSNVSRILRSEQQSAEKTSDAEMSLEKHPKIVFSKGNSFAITKQARYSNQDAQVQEDTDQEQKEHRPFVIHPERIQNNMTQPGQIKDVTLKSLEKVELNNPRSAAPTKKSWFQKNTDPKPTSFLGIPGIPQDSLNHSYTALPRPPSKEHLPIDVHKKQIEAITSHDGLEDLQKHELMVKLREKYSYLIDSSSSLPKRRLMSKSTYLKPFFNSRYKVLKKANQTAVPTQDMNDMAEDEPTTTLIEYRIPALNAQPSYLSQAAQTFYAKGNFNQRDPSVHSSGDTEPSQKPVPVGALVQQGRLISQRKRRLANPEFFLSRSLSKIPLSSSSRSGTATPAMTTFYKSYNTMVPHLNELSHRFRVEESRVARLTSKLSQTNNLPNRRPNKKARHLFPNADVMVEELN